MISAVVGAVEVNVPEILIQEVGVNEYRQKLLAMMEQVTPFAVTCREPLTADHKIIEFTVNTNKE